MDQLGPGAAAAFAAPVIAVEPAGASGGLLSLLAAEVRLGLSSQAPTLSPLSLRVHAGERLALVGANGSGKSTLLRCLHGLQPLSAGQRWAAPGLRMAMLFQRPHLLRMRVWRNLAWGLWLQGVPWTQTRERALAALARVGLADLAERNGRGLSGGQQQRVALARAWALRPDVWLLDEPTASLDPHAKREVEALVAEFSAEAPVTGVPPTLIFSSHNLGQVKRLASRVLYLERGRLLADLPVQRFFEPGALAVLCPEAHAFVQGEML